SPGHSASRTCSRCSRWPDEIANSFTRAFALLRRQAWSPTAWEPTSARKPPRSQIRSSVAIASQPPFAELCAPQDRNAAGTAEELSLTNVPHDGAACSETSGRGDQK